MCGAFIGGVIVGILVMLVVCFWLGEAIMYIELIAVNAIRTKIFNMSPLKRPQFIRLTESVPV